VIAGGVLSITVLMEDVAAFPHASVAVIVIVAGHVPVVDADKAI
jgi:hypothetical protein